MERCLAETELVPVSIAVDTFTQAKWRQGSFSSTSASVRRDAVEDTKRVMDLAAALNCPTVTIWPGQDGYDYLFQADYIQEREWFTDAVAETCAHRSDVDITLEYKAKEPRTHSYVSTVGTTILMLQAVQAKNLGIAFDFGHALLGYENPAESVALMKQYGDWLRHVHINDNYRHWDDDMIVGTVRSHEYLEFFYWLRRTGYEGWMTIDQFPYREDGQEAVAESAAWLDAVERKIDDADLDKIGAVLARKDAIASSKLMRKLLLG
ncbi:MAG: sugar phosphate isomerase/epimerase family protein [Planctomycetota bacterium]